MAVKNVALLCHQLTPSGEKKNLKLKLVWPDDIFWVNFRGVCYEQIDTTKLELFVVPISGFRHKLHLQNPLQAPDGINLYTVHKLNSNEKNLCRTGL